ncbi:MAG: hypothetical protein A3H98_05380 [Bacteroidetes bacterium RIFCSPLOWO2_02_FULL_36_8]|nr:MAG: hypothetical protein A3H98_05380 [Bacteroidetes bacterium RIFCSPLOWO2_02_FULL_36_8]OFY70303.1 MAG: hypothetical protein A3G23_09210 [Bacteroidetes bacterium RIFCSPLOWO2_12_FULL_37_12]
MNNTTFPRFPKIYLIIFLVALISACATYFQTQYKFHEKFMQGQLESAVSILDKDKKAATNNHRLLYFLNKGVVLNMLGKYEESNQILEQAYFYVEDVKANIAEEALSLVTNPMSKPYKPEDFEKVLLHYYKAINYIKLAQYDEALVECRRINIKLNKLNDKNAGRKNRYRKDAFSENLSGMIYEASGNYNDAFVSYRNAYETYRDDYKNFFGINVPEQLKEDLIRSAKLSGLREEKEFYEKEFGLNYIESSENSGQLIFIWNNGLGPVKDEWSINFTIIKGSGGMVTFANEEHGLNFPVYAGEDNNGKSKLSDISFVRAAFPKYSERPPYYYSAEISTSATTKKLETAENINDIAFKTLEDRMWRELGNTVLRVALKQVAEAQARKQNEGLGMVVSLANALTEKADTRNWQTLPYSINYSRIFLPEGEHDVTFSGYSGSGTPTLNQTFHFTIKKGKTTFHTYHTLSGRGR